LAASPGGTAKAPASCWQARASVNGYSGRLHRDGGSTWIFHIPAWRLRSERGSIEPQHVRTSGRFRLTRGRPTYRICCGSQTRGPG